MKIVAQHPLAELHDPVSIPVGAVVLEGDLDVPEGGQSLVVFAHGSGSSRHSPRNQFVARVLREAGLGTLLIDLLTSDEERIDAVDGSLRFDIPLLASRLVAVTNWLRCQPGTRQLKMAYFGASTGAAAALIAAAKLGDRIRAVVSRGGRPDLAKTSLPQVTAATLFIVGGYDEMVIALNDGAYELLRCEKDFRIVPGATHLFEEPGKLEQVAEFSARWFTEHVRE